jgi:hypothetical protein
MQIATCAAGVAIEQSKCGTYLNFGRSKPSLALLNFARKATAHSGAVSGGTLAAGYAADSSLAICGMLGGLLDDIMMCLQKSSKLQAAAERHTGYSCVSAVWQSVSQLDRNRPIKALIVPHVTLLLEAAMVRLKLRRLPLLLTPGVASSSNIPGAIVESSGSTVDRRPTSYVT